VFVTCRLPFFRSAMSTALDSAESTRVQVELVYFDIHARGELTRLCYAAAGRSADLTDTRIPLFMESPENAWAWTTQHEPKTPFGYLPYLNIRVGDGPVRQISGDGAVETFVARRLRLMGRDAVDESVCTTISTAAVGLLGPGLTRAGLRGMSKAVAAAVHPRADLGEVLANLERYVRKLMESTARQEGDKYIVASQLTLADLAIFNCLDECLLGPRGNNPLQGVAEVLKEYYPNLIKTYDVVKQDLAGYLIERQAKHEKP